MRFLRLLLIHLLISPATYAQRVDTTGTSLPDPVVEMLDSLQHLHFFSCNSALTDSCMQMYAEGKPTGIPMVDELLIEARLAKLDAASPFDLRYNSQVKNYIELYAVRKRSLVARLLSLSRYYFPLFEEKLAAYDLPIELKYLAVVESALNAKAVSKSGAMGLWQFMYPTGKMYGLEVNSFTDLRCDPAKSSEAACQYFRYLYRIFGDWQMVLAAYNCGPGTVSRAIRRSGGISTYWELRPFLPTETQGYVPAFIAANYVMNFAEEHHIYPVPFKSSFYFTDTVQVNQPVEYAAITALLGLQHDEIRFLNPVYRMGSIPAGKGTSTLRLPSDLIPLFLQKEEELYAYNRKGTQGKAFAWEQKTIQHKVKKGQSVSTLAKLYGVSKTDIKVWNKLKTEKLKSGSTVKIIQPVKRYFKPEPDTTRAIAADSLSRNQEPAVAPDTASTLFETNSAELVHTVQKGDTLWNIVKLYKMESVEELRKLNGLHPSVTLVPGQRLKVKKSVSP